MFGSRSSVLASSRDCRWPPESPSPPSIMTCSRPRGSLRTNSSAPHRVSTEKISSSVAAGRPRIRFSRRVPWNSRASWVSKVALRRISARSICGRLKSSSRSSPETSSTLPIIACSRVDLPAPIRPRMAILSPALMDNWLIRSGIAASLRP